MGKIETYTKNRVEGLVWALDLIKKEESLEKGVEMLKSEIRFRKATFIPLEIPADSIRECSTLLAKRLMNTLLIVFFENIRRRIWMEDKTITETGGSVCETCECIL